MNTNEIVSKAFVAHDIITIDPGKSGGGIVRYNQDIYQATAISKIINEDALVEFLQYQAEISKLPLVFIEKLTSFSGDFNNKGMNENSKIGMNFNLDKMKRHYAELIAAIKIARLPFIEVMAVSWQSYLQIRQKGEDSIVRKKRFRDIAAGWYPYNQVTAWNADAFLIQQFAQKKLKYDQRWVLKYIQKPKPKKLFNYGT